MALLTKYANNEPNETKDKTLTARIKPSLYNDFKEHCDGLGINISRAIELLIENELNENTKQHTPSITKTNTPSNTNVIQNVNKPKPYNTNRFTTTEYERENKLPCPVCNKWYSKANFSRHAKTGHSQTTQELLQSNKPKVMEMIATN